MASSRYGNRVLAGLALLLLAQVGFLALRRSQAAPAVAPRFLVEGDAIGPVRLEDAEGTSRSLQELADGARATVLLVFDSECAHCEDVADDWRAWIDRAPEDVRVLTVTREARGPAEAYAREHAWGAPVVRVLDPVPGTPDMSVVMRTPWLVVIDADGRVTYQNQGSHLAEVDAALGDLADAPPS